MEKRIENIGKGLAREFELESIRFNKHDEYTDKLFYFGMKDNKEFLVTYSSKFDYTNIIEWNPLTIKEK